MKKILALLCVFLLCSAFQCDDEPLEGDFVAEAEAACQEAALNTAEAALAFLGAGDATYTEICNAYKTAIEAQIIACGDEDGSLLAIIEDLGDCTQDVVIDDGCDDAIAAKNEAEVAFNASTDTNYTENCNALKEAIQLVIDTCGPTTELQDQLDGLGNCILTTNPVTGEITVTAGTLDIVFDVITVDAEGTLLKVMGETSAANEYEVYFEVEEGETGMELINSTFMITFTSVFSASSEGFEPFTSNITTNAEGVLQGTFSGNTRNADNADLSLTSGNINIEF